MNQNFELIEDLLNVLISIKDTDQMYNFLKDLCTPQELKALSERWYVCRLLNEGTLSYREINAQTGVSLATITRVARFLKDEPHHGYRNVLDNLSKKKFIQASTRAKSVRKEKT